ncbi:MAG: site-specific integrase [Alphaproteobacteria bacterium]|nr:site-specific integrase [Alphaproteobacteria bacterium]
MASFEKRTAKDGSTGYRAKVRIKGQPPQSATFKRLTDAREWAKQIEVDMKNGLYFKKTQARKRTVAEVIDRYIEYLRLEHPRRLETTDHMLEWWKKKLGHHFLSGLSEDMISEAMSGLLKQQVPNREKGQTYTKATVNRYKSALQTALSMAVSPWGWMEHNPAQSVKSMKESPGRTRFLSKDELARLLRCCRESEGKYLYSIVVVALSSGARREEVRSIKWEDVLLDEGKIILRKTKNKRHRTIHLAHRALQEIRKRSDDKGRDDIYVFPSEKGPDKPIDFRTAWRTVLKNSSIKDFHFHDLRHTAASYLAMNGATPSEIAEVLGHQSLSMVKRYAHLCDSHTATVVKRMNERMLIDA